MKKLFALFVFANLFLLGCETENPSPPQLPTTSNYDFTDLSPNENLLDSIISKGRMAGSGMADYKFIYKNKRLIHGVKFIVDTSTFLYNNTTLSKFLYNQWGENIAFNFSLNSNGEPIRFYQFDDNYPNAQYRQLGTFITYTNNYPSRSAHLFINSNYERDSIIVNMRRNQFGDIDTIYIGDPPFPSNYWLNVFEYTTIPNKLKDNANLKIIPLLNTTTLPGLRAGRVLNIEIPYISDYSAIRNQLFQLVLFTSKYLPSKYHYKDGYTGQITYYIKYAFNANGYITKLSIGTEPNFDPLINQIAEFTYYGRP